MKILMLILASDGGPGNIYTHLQGVWRAYMQRFPQIETYFYKGRPTQPEISVIEGDTLYVKCGEGLQNVHTKLKLAITHFESRFHEFDYILRPNLSSFFILDRYLHEVKEKPREKFAWGHIIRHHCTYPTGCGFTISMDIAKEIVTHKFQPKLNGADDMCVGFVLQDMKVPVTPAKMTVLNYSIINKQIEQIKNDTSLFHIRIRHQANRVSNDLWSHTRLLKEIYDIDFEPNVPLPV